MATLTYTQEDLVRLVEADARRRASPKSMMIHVLIRGDQPGQSRIEVQVDLDAPPPGPASP